ncbi:MAG: hypothetical protein GF331_22365 [Chitinivibrionales bacterium]|nr:hypothetical protein [Chitinivibrionales bacterium]
MKGILPLMLLLATHALPTTYFVDAQRGDDNHTGTDSSSAWRSLAKVNNRQFGAGDSVLFRGGRSWSGTLAPSGSGGVDRPLVFGRYGPGTQKPHIDAGGATEPVILKNMAHLIFEDFRLTNHADSPLRRARGIYLYADGGRTIEDVTVQRCELTDIIGDSRQATRWLNGSIFTDSDGNAHFVKLRILDNHIHDVTVRGITGNQDVTNWENPATMHDSVTIAGNLIDNIGADGIRVIASKNVLVEHNTVYRCGANIAGMELNYIAACFPQQCVNTLWQFNEIAYTAHSNPSVGDEDSEAFDIDWGCGGTHTFQYNYTHDNVGGFFLFMGHIVDRDADKVGAFEQAIIRYNISENDGIREPIPRICEIHPFDGKTFRLLFHNNTFYNKNEIGIHLKNSADYTGIEFRNNIFHAPRASYREQGLVWDNNLYFGHAAPSYDPDAVTGDPMLISPGSGGDGMDGALAYRISAGSAARGSGIVIADNGDRDFWGDVLPDDAPDIGADQYLELVGATQPRPPARQAGSVTVSTNADAVVVSGCDASTPVHLFSPGGRAVQSVVSDVNGMAGFDVAHLARGTYMVRVQAGSHTRYAVYMKR